ncbi:MAG: cysteine--tRNA ligase [Candidatus Gracilibacteria bacterium]|nr:cysteine--tRNA ligase [Candidatus Gracilibacteria bacterium]
MNLYNTLTNQLEEFKPLNPPEVLMYNCGPTVYNFAHIGNLSSYLMADLLRRYMEYKGFKVKQVMNITDVGHLVSDSDTGEDKMEKAAREQQLDPLDVARKYEETFHTDRKKLNILDAHHYPRATEMISEQLDTVKKLMGKGFAYETSDGYYFDVQQFPEYGKLSNNKLDDLKAGERVDVNTEKKHPADFALWKKCVGENKNHILRWSFETGEKMTGTEENGSVGFPGWHIECSAMASSLLGKTIDIHTGGEDNIFPHHDCEIAQSRAITGEDIFAKYWVHKRHIFVDGEKMSKSKGNFFTMTDIEEKGYSPLAYRYLILSIHYRQNTNFTFKGLDDAVKNIERLQNFLVATQNASDNGPEVAIQKFREDFETSLDDDLNTSGALGAVFELVKEGNKALAESGGIKNRLDVLNFLRDFDQIFAVLSWDLEEELDPQVEIWMKKRDQARAEKDFEKADEIRDKLKEEGIEIMDKDGKTVWKKSS